MSSVNIAIKDEAYSFLKSLKSKDESFSDVILKFKEKKATDGKALIKLAERFRESLAHVDWEDRERKMKEIRESVNRRIKRTTDYMDEVRT